LVDLARNEHRAGIASLEQGAAAVEPQAELLLLGRVTFVARIHQDGANLGLKELFLLGNDRRSRFGPAERGGAASETENRTDTSSHGNWQVGQTRQVGLAGALIEREPPL